MKIAFVLHDLSMTGAPILGLNIARFLSETNDVVIYVKKNGPLIDRINEFGIEVIITNTSHEISNLSLSSRIDSGIRDIADKNYDFIYVNSLASGEWVSIAQYLNIPYCLHVHEAENGIRDLMKINIFDSVDVSKCKTVIAASQSSKNSFSKLFGTNLNYIYNFDVAINVDEITALSIRAVKNPSRYDGKVLHMDNKRDKYRKVLCMCGTAQKRKGSDLFWHVAKKRQDCDFVWIGPWDDPDTQQINPAIKLNRKEPLANLYWTGGLDNPYPNILNSDLLILTSDEDPNPLVVLEALTLGVPVFAFTETGNSHQYTSRFSYALSGKPSLARIVAYIDVFTNSTKMQKLKETTEYKKFVFDIDLRQKVKECLTIINKSLKFN